MPAPVSATCPTVAVHHEELTIPGYGSLVVGWGDYTLRQIRAETVNIKVKNGSFLDNMSPAVWEVQLTLYKVENAAFQAMRATAETAMNTYISTGTGNITLALAGITLNNMRITQFSNVGQLYYDDDGNDFLESLTLVLQRPIMSWF